MRPLGGKQKRHLRALGIQERPILQVGKQGLTAALVRQAADALLSRELVKGRVLDTAPADPAEAAAGLASATGAAVVQVIGRNFLLFKRNTEDPRIELPE